MKNIVIGLALVAVLIIGGSFVLKGISKSKSNSKTVSEIAQVFENDSILKSDDGGLNFSRGFKIETKSKIGAVDILAIAFNPITPGNIVIGSLEDGLFKKENGKENWIPIPFPPKKIYSFLLDNKNPDNRIFVSGMSDGYGKVFRTEDNGGNWRTVYTEPGVGTVVTALSQDPRNKDIIFSGTSRGTVIKSVDGGQSWKNVGNTIEGTIKDISFDATKPLNTYLLAFRNKMYYSINRGETWLDWEIVKNEEIQALNTRISKLFSSDRIAEGEQAQKDMIALEKKNQEGRAPQGIIVIVPDPLKTGIVYAGTDKGLFRSADYGKYWKEINIIESAKMFPIRSISINPKNSNEVSFVSGKSFYKSINFGDTWSVTPLNSERDAYFVSYNPFNLKEIYIGLSQNISF
jgi:photosystem II stability/assembly factor-like uncharacterized protein